MLAITLADLRYRYRQFLIAVVGAAVVLAMAVLLSGLAAGFRTEIHRTIFGVGADSWLLSDKANGRITAVATFPQNVVKDVAAVPGVTHADGVAFLPHEVLQYRGSQVTANVMGVAIDGLGAPVVRDGHALRDPGDMVVDARAKLHTGDLVQLGSARFHIVGTVSHRSLGAGIPMAYVSLADSQEALFDGSPIITAVVTKGLPAHAPPGLSVLTAKQVENSTLKTLASGVQSIKNSRALMWVIAVIIVSALIYVSALQRVRDFAVLKALGSSSAALFGSLCLQAVIVTLVGAAVGVALSTVMTGIFPQPITVPASAYYTLPLVAIGVGVVASLVALRRATGADPVAAFGG